MESSSNLELRIRADRKNRRNLSRELRSYGIDRATTNLLIKDGYRRSAEIYDETDQLLLSIRGIGRKRLSRVRQALLPYYLRLVS